MIPIARTLLLASLALSPLVPGDAAWAQETGARRQYVYVLRLTPSMHDKASWTDAENAAVGRHFARLAKAAEAGQVILAGRTAEPLDRTFGLVVFEAESDVAARQFMETDPAVIAGVMSATLHPYSVALMRNRSKGLL